MFCIYYTISQIFNIKDYDVREDDFMKLCGS
jgi:hypothetical protein